jgi:hypothetical protein
MNTEVKNTDSKKVDGDARPVEAIKDEKWGELPEDNFGYASDEERRAKRGLEDWELLEGMPDSQKPVPRWFFAIIVAVMMVAVGLSFPFWGDRPGYEREWINWGFGAALLYVAVFGTFVYFMVTFYGSKFEKRLNRDKSGDKQNAGANVSEDNKKNDTAKD